MQSDALKQAAVAALEDIKARDIAVLDTRRLTSLFDFLIVATGDSSRQVKALSTHLQERIKSLGAPIHGAEGEKTGEWILVDLGDVVVNIMLPASREYYNLEELWTEPGSA